MQRIPREKAYTYDLVPKEPLLRVERGEEFVVETEDANNGKITKPEHLPIAKFLPEVAMMTFNPCAGPIYVKGAEKGDVLVVKILDIIPDKQGHSLFVKGNNHPLDDSASWAECQGPYTHILKHVPGPSGTTSDGRAILNERFSWNLNPHIGTIGVAPLRPVAAGSDTMYGQGPWGGNYDVRDMCKGSILYLPVYHEGGLLYLGDVHGCQADSEFYGVADETRAEVRVSCDVIKNKTIPFPRLETKDSIIQLNSYRPVETAITRAFLWMMEWLVSEYGFGKREAYLNMGLNPKVRINVYQMTPVGRINYTVGVQFPKESLPK